MKRDAVFGLYLLPTPSERLDLDRRMLEALDAPETHAGDQVLRFRQRSGLACFYPHLIEKVAPPFPGFHSHAFFEIAIAVRGEAEFLTQDSRATLSGGDLIFIRPHLRHKYQKKTKVFSLFNICFDAHLVDPGYRSESPGQGVPRASFWEPFFRNDGYFNGRMHLDEKDFKKILHIAFSLAEDFKWGEERSQSHLRGFLYFFEKILACYRRRVPLSQIDSPFSSRVLDYVRGQPHSKLSLGDLALKLEVHPYYLGKKFKKETGISLGAYLHKQRIRWVLEQIEIREKSDWKSIVRDAGFGSVSRFYAVFTRETGLTPARYRREMIKNVTRSR